jgi:hypothetical protein
MNNKTNLHNNVLEQSCRMLKQKFKGVINPTTIWTYSPDKWKSAGRASAGRKGGFTANRNRLFAAEIPANSKEEPLTEYEQQYVKVHEAKMQYKEQIEKLIDYYLNLIKEEKIHITSRTPKGSDSQKALIEKARDNMLKLAKRLNDAEQSSTNYNEISRVKNILKIGTSFLWSIHCIHLFTVLEDI